MTRMSSVNRPLEPTDTKDLPPAPVAAVVAALADACTDGAALFIAQDEQRAQAIAAAMVAALPDAMIIHIPSSDALPGDRSLPSPANAGRRATAFHRLRQSRGRGSICVATTFEAAIRLYPPPDAFDVAPPRLTIGDTIDVPALALELAEIGYLHD